MVNIRYDVINDEILEVARIISTAQKTTVKIITSTETMEVHYEEISEGENSEGKTS